jgi:hypothetical protein
LYTLCKICIYLYRFLCAQLFDDHDLRYKIRFVIRFDEELFVEAFFIHTGLNWSFENTKSCSKPYGERIFVIIIIVIYGYSYGNLHNKPTSILNHNDTQRPQKKGLISIPQNQVFLSANNHKLFNILTDHILILNGFL